MMDLRSSVEYLVADTTSIVPRPKSVRGPVARSNLGSKIGRALVPCSAEWGQSFPSFEHCSGSPKDLWGKAPVMDVKEGVNDALIGHFSSQ